MLTSLLLTYKTKCLWPRSSFQHVQHKICCVTHAEIRHEITNTLCSFIFFPNVQDKVFVLTSFSNNTQYSWLKGRKSVSALYEIKSSSSLNCLYLQWRPPHSMILSSTCINRKKKNSCSSSVGEWTSEWTSEWVSEWAGLLAVVQADALGYLSAAERAVLQSFAAHQAAAHVAAGQEDDLSL